MLQGAHEVASGMETKGVPQHERNPKMLKAMLFTGMLAAGLLGGASFAGANEPGRWNSAPYIAVAPLITSSDQDISAAIDQITTFPTVLDPRLWDGDKLRPDVRARTLEIVTDLFADLKMPDLAIKNVEIRGSTVSYEYDDNADLSVRVFLDTSNYKGDVKQLNALLKTYTDYLEAVYEGTLLLRGVPLEPQFYAVKSPSQETQAGIGHYSLTDDAWMEHPSIQENRFDRNQIMTDAKGFIAEYNRLVSDYFADKKAFDCGRLGAFTKEMRKYRGAGIDKDGTRSTSNLTYRMLRRLNVNLTETARQLAVECRAIHWTLE
ncbi:MAG: hypothetical protein RJA94_948 [Pseudomonadota bacterium]|jgi:hypothetical protein